MAGISIIIYWLRGYNDYIQCIYKIQGKYRLSCSCSTTLVCVSPGMEGAAIIGAQIVSASLVLDGSTSPGKARLHLKADRSNSGG